MRKRIQFKSPRISGLIVLGLLAAALTLVAIACGSGSESPTQPSAPQAAAPAAQAQAGTQAAGTQRQPAQPAAAQPAAAAISAPTAVYQPPAVVKEQRAALSGTIEIDGSSTVFPITEAVAEEFNKVASSVRVNVGVSGSGGGFKRFVVGETDISDASRPIKESEAAIARENGISYYEFLVGVDGLSVMVSPDNDFVECLTIEQLHELWKPESAVQNWSDLDPSWPDRQINLYGPGTDSGTFDYFTEEVNGESGLSRADYTASEDDNVLVQGINGDRNALGYFGYAYYAENVDKLKLVAVDSGEGCVAPSVESIADGSYSPLSRPLFIYVSHTSLQRPEVKAFVEFYMENGAELTAEVGYVPLSAQDYQSNLALAQQFDPADLIRMEDKTVLNLSGTIEIDGSSTVFPITEAVAEEFNKIAPEVRVNVGVSGSGGGFKRFVVGETDISDASRPIKESEAAIARENGISYYEFLVGVDGLSVMVSPDNDFVECLTIEQLHELWKPESAVQNWSDLDPSWPDRQINLYGPGTDSGTFDYFTEEVNGESGLSRADYTASEDDNVLVQGINGDRNALGYFGYAYYAENVDKLKLVAVDSGEGCVAPSVESIADGSYSPLSRPLFIYVSKASLARPEVREFVEFYMINGRALTAEVGYVPLSVNEYQHNLNLAQGRVAQVSMDSLSGTIEIDGSSTVFPITEAVAEEFNKVASSVRVNVGVSGSGGGFKRFVVGETDVSDASRPIKESEAATARENGIEYFEFLVGVDGLSVMVSPDNDFVECLTVEQLHELWKPESAVQNWSDLDTSWPNRQINLYGPGTDSGTFDYFTEEVNGESGLSRADYTASEDDNVLVQGISGDRNALGYFGYAYYAENVDRLKLVAVDSGEGCVAPSVESIADGSYSPLSRPLFIYVSKESLARPEVREFVKFYMEHGAELTAEVGYVPLSAQEYQRNLELVSQ